MHENTQCGSRILYIFNTFGVSGKQREIGGKKPNQLREQKLAFQWFLRYIYIIRKGYYSVRKIVLGWAQDPKIQSPLCLSRSINKLYGLLS